MLATGYTLSTTTELGFTEAVERVRDELKAEGFGVLCEIDVQATLKEKLGVEGEPYLILGACNPPLAHQALQAEPELGVLLPCNVVVYPRDGGHTSLPIDAERMLSIVGNDELSPVAADVREQTRACRRARRRSLSRAPLHSNARSIDAAAVAERLADSSVTVIDVRQPAEWRRGHIRGSLNMPLTSSRAASTGSRTTRRSSPSARAATAAPSPPAHSGAPDTRLRTSKAACAPGPAPGCRSARIAANGAEPRNTAPRAVPRRRHALTVTRRTCLLG